MYLQMTVLGGGGADIPLLYICRDVSPNPLWQLRPSIKHLYIYIFYIFNLTYEVYPGRFQWPFFKDECFEFTNINCWFFSLIEEIGFIVFCLNQRMECVCVCALVQLSL